MGRRHRHPIAEPGSQPPLHNVLASPPTFEIAAAVAPPPHLPPLLAGGWHQESRMWPGRCPPTPWPPPPSCNPRAARGGHGVGIMDHRKGVQWSEEERQVYPTIIFSFLYLVMGDGPPWRFFVVAGIRAGWLMCVCGCCWCAPAVVCSHDHPLQIIFLSFLSIV